jgi:hypothetical protein
LDDLLDELSASPGGDQGARSEPSTREDKREGKDEEKEKGKEGGEKGGEKQKERRHPLRSKSSRRGDLHRKDSTSTFFFVLQEQELAKRSLAAFSGVKRSLE